MNQGVRQHGNLASISAAGAANADTPAIGELCDSLVVEPEFINAMRAVKESNTRCHETPDNWNRQVGNGRSYLAEFTSFEIDAPCEPRNSV